MKYPTTIEQFSDKIKKVGGTVDEDNRGFFEALVDLLNDAYFQGRLDEAMYGTCSDE